MNILSQAIDRDRTDVRLDQVYATAAQCVARLLLVLKRRIPDGRAFDDAQRALATLPVPTPRFALASHRLDNARAYCAQRERGAAVYELRILHGILLREANLGR